MVFHLFPNEKFTYGYITKLDELFDQKNNLLYIYGKQRKCPDSVFLPSHVRFDYKMNIIHRFLWIAASYFKADRVMLHSLPNIRFLIWICIIQKIFRKKFIWGVWGGDLYDVYNLNINNPSVKSKLRELVRRTVISKLYIICIGKEYKDLKKWYKTNAKIISGVPYYYKFIDRKTSNNNDNIVNIIVGHSATETCQHIDAFKKLEKYKDKIRIYCPMSYPDDPEYIGRVEKTGKAIFGDKCIVIKDFMKYDDYITFLGTIDIGIFNNNRQQGNGNITNLLYLGKKIYVNTNNIIYDTYKELGTNIFEIREIDNEEFLIPFTEAQMQKNKNIVLEQYSDKTFKDKWQQVFTS